MKNIAYTSLLMKLVINRGCWFLDSLTYRILPFVFFFAGVNGTALSARTEHQKEHCPFCPYNTRKKNMTAIFSLSVFIFFFFSVSYGFAVSVTCCPVKMLLSSVLCQLSSYMSAAKILYLLSNKYILLFVPFISSTLIILPLINEVL